MSIEILKSGLLTTIQDNGRKGYQDQGIPVSGFMDVYSAQLANLLVGNDKNEAQIETTLIPCSIRFYQKTIIAVTGADIEVFVNQKQVSLNKTLEVEKDAILSFGKLKKGCRNYIAFQGGIDAPKILGSKSTYIIAGLGGLNGKALQKEDLIPLRTIQNENNVAFGKVKQRVLSNSLVLELIKGPEFSDFPEKTIIDFLSQTFQVSKDANRMGIRLEGESLELGEKKDIISSAVVKGLVQITSKGTPIIMMSDAPTTGGYLRIGVLTDKSCDLLAQAVMGDEVRFRFIS